MKFTDAMKEAKFLINDDQELCRIDPQYAISMKWLQRDDWKPFDGKIVKVYEGLYELRYNSNTNCLQVDNLQGIFMNSKVRVTIEEIK